MMVAQPRPISDDFRRAYESGLVQVAASIRESKPDVIMAFTRKAPRLLELLQKWGYWSGGIPVITQRSVPFISPEELKGKRVLLFDDIVISGTTIFDRLVELVKKYDAIFEVLCLAIDRDTIALQPNGPTEFVFKLPQLDVPLRFGISLSISERFTFCNLIVRSFAELNKPYDSDHCILYTTLNEAAWNSLTGAMGGLEVHDLTTIAQAGAGFHRFTLLPRDPEEARVWFREVFGIAGAHLQLAKIRAYYQPSTGALALAPMILFTSPSDELSSFELKEEGENPLGMLLHAVRAQLSGEKDKKPLFSFVSFLASYLYGRRLLEMLGGPTGWARDAFTPSKLSLSSRDIVYLFGERTASTILDGLATFKTSSLLKAKPHGSGGRRQRADTERREAAISPAAWDADQILLYGEIRDGVARAIHKPDFLASQLAVVFETMYSLLEIPAERRIKEHGLHEDDSRRLRRGFTYDQLQEILVENGALAPGERGRIRLHLALDFLVDAGVAVPIFRSAEIAGREYLQRCFRYGEDGLSGRQYGYAMALTFEDLFDYCKTKEGQKRISRVTLEKTGVMLHQMILDRQWVDVLKEKVGPDDRDLAFATRYLEHGKVMAISDEAIDRFERPGFQAEYFVEWCEREGILRGFPGGGMAYEMSFLVETRLDKEVIPFLTSRDRIGTLKGVSRVCYWISNKLGERYLIALVTCCDHESYLSAVREELKLFLTSKKRKVGTALDLAIRASATPGAFSSANLLSSLAEATRSRELIHRARDKRKLWEETMDILDKTDSFFSQDRDLGATYEALLSPYVDQIRQARLSSVHAAVAAFQERLEAFSELCISMAEALVSVIGSLGTESGPAPLAARADQLRLATRRWDEFCGHCERDAPAFSGFPRLGDSIRVQHDADLAFPTSARFGLEWLEALENAQKALLAYYRLYYSDSEFSAAMVRLSEVQPKSFRRLSVAEPAPFELILWYDMKDSTGARDHSNKVRATSAKKRIPGELEKVRLATRDGRFDEKEDDEKFIYIQRDLTAGKYLEATLLVMWEQGVFARISLLDVTDVGIPLQVRAVGREIEIAQNSAHHTLGQRLGSFEKDHGPWFTVSITKVAYDRLWSNVVADLEPKWRIRALTPLSAEGAPEPQERDVVGNGRKVQFYKFAITRTDAGQQDLLGFSN